MSVRADLISANEAYYNKDYPAALNEFKKLARLGNKKAQFNLGVMYLKGEGVKADPVEAYAWFRLANETPNPKTSQALEILEKNLSPEELAAAKSRSEELLKQYGEKKLYTSLSPLIINNANEDKREKVKIKPVRRVAPQYPRTQVRKGQQGWVSVQFEVNPDGTVHHPRVIESFPQGQFDKETVAALEKWRFDVQFPKNSTPHPVTATQVISYVFGDETAQAHFARRFKKHLAKIRQVAEAGNPTAQYLYAILAHNNPILREENLISEEEANKWLLKAAKNGQSDAQFLLGQNILSGKGCKAEKQKGLFWITQSAEQGHPRAAHLIAEILANQSVENHTGRTAQEWLEFAAESGDADAMLRWAEMVAETDTSSPQALAQAREFLSKVKKQRKPGPQWYGVSALLYEKAGEPKKAARAEKKARQLEEKYNRLTQR